MIGPIEIAARNNRGFLRLGKGNIDKIFFVLPFFKAKFFQLGRRIKVVTVLTCLRFKKTCKGASMVFKGQGI